MPKCDAHSIREISCGECYTNEELEAEVQKLQATKLPAPPGSRKAPKRSDDKKPKRSSWLDDMVGD